MRKAWNTLLSYPWVIACLAVAAVGFLLLAWPGSVVGNLSATQIWVSSFALLVAADQFRAMVRDLMAGAWGIDILAIVAIGATVAVGEYWAALVVCLMLSGGEALEDYAAGRARGELTALLSRAPREAHLLGADGTTRTVAVEDVEVGQVLMIRPNDVVPVDGELLDASASIDESSLTGESLPVERLRGEAVMSGAVNGAQAVRMRATARAAESQYQQIMTLVQQAAESRSPMVRLADKIAVPFTLAALAIAAIAWWVSGEALRAAQVLVVATPCPLLIAAPVAFMGGMSRAAREGIIVKDGGTIERLSRIRMAAFDKTGTLTRGEPRVTAVLPAAGFSRSEVLGCAAAVETLSTHPLATAIVAAAREQGASRYAAQDVCEIPAVGVSGQVRRPGRNRAETVQVGKYDDAAPGTVPVPAGASMVHVVVGGQYAGAIAVADTARPEAAQTVRDLRRMGVRDVLMLTGDGASGAAPVAEHVGITSVHSGLLPHDKLRAVQQATIHPVMMVGDGVNDAPVLAAADVGVAMGARGASAASQSADVVIMNEDVHRAAVAVSIGQHTTRVASQAIGIGVALSLGLMTVAVAGFLPAIAGAAAQEIVDLACIVWALRAMRPGRREVAPRAGVWAAPVQSAAASAPAEQLRGEVLPASAGRQQTRAA